MYMKTYLAIILILILREKQNPAACSGFTYEENLKVMKNNYRSESSRALTLSADLKPVRSSESRLLSFGICFLCCSLLPLSLSVSSDREVVRPLKKKWQGWNGMSAERKNKREKSAGGSTRGLCCQLDTTQMERGWVRDVDGVRERTRGGKWEGREKTQKEWLGKYYRTAGERERREQRRSGGG